MWQPKEEYLLWQGYIYLQRTSHPTFLEKPPISQALAIDEAQYEVRVNTISPGNVWTPLWESGANATEDPEKVVQGGKDAQLLGRMGTIEEIGKMCLYLASEATFCTGIGTEVKFNRFSLARWVFSKRVFPKCTFPEHTLPNRFFPKNQLVRHRWKGQDDKPHRTRPEC